LENPNNSEDDCTAVNESDIQYNNCIEDPEFQEQQHLSSTPTDPRLVMPTRKSKTQADKVLLTVNTVETRRNNGLNKKLDIIHQWFTSFFM